jgi:hypothetical protein
VSLDWLKKQKQKQKQKTKKKKKGVLEHLHQKEEVG